MAFSASYVDSYARQSVAMSWSFRVCGSSIWRGTPRQALELLSKRLNGGVPVATRPQVEPVFVVQEELPVANDRAPHEQKRHGRRERPKVAL